MSSAFKLSVCPHDTAKNLFGWFALNTHLQHHLGAGIHFEPQDNFLAERKAVIEGDYHVVYANPYSVLCFARDKGFVPVARPAGVTDETLVVTRAGATVPPAPRIASATDRLIIHNLGLQVLGPLGIDASQAQFSFVGNHLNAAKAVLQGNADLGFVFNETWSGMNESTRAQLQVLDQSRDGLAFHCFMVAPAWGDKREAIQRILCNMHNDPSGQRALADLKFERFEPVGEEILAPLAKLAGAAQC